jgi:hypothetical protein
MYDALTTRYRLPCPRRGQTSVLLSGFRRLEELAGTHHPAIYRVEFACGCGEVHAGLVPHDELDWAPLGLKAETSFVNFMTSRRDSLAAELSDIAAQKIKAGQWPWSFFCWPEERPRPVFPSAFWLLAAGQRGDSLVVAVRCPDCGRVSVNLVSRDHVDVPFHNDRDVGVLTHVFDDDAARPLEGFGTDLVAAGFESRRLDL